MRATSRATPPSDKAVPLGSVGLALGDLRLTPKICHWPPPFSAETILRLLWIENGERTIQSSARRRRTEEHLGQPSSVNTLWQARNRVCHETVVSADARTLQLLLVHVKVRSS